MSTVTSRKVQFKINGADCEVGCEVTSETTLLDYIRKTLNLHGTKYMCREGGCGACIVSAKKNPDTPGQSVNSCMVSVTSCQDWDITTIEDLGNKKKGYHVLQTTLAKDNGSQCGHCSPGWVMSMYGLLQSKKNLTMLEIERSLSSNVCRCTGYRPILKAFRRFASDAPKQILLDIEDLHNCKKEEGVCKKKCDNNDWCIVTKEEVQQMIIKICLKDNRVWYRVSDIVDIFEIFKIEGDNCYMLVAGNTAKGAYPIAEYPRILIDISGVKVLKKYEIDQNLEIGAGNTLTEILKVFEIVSEEEDFSYLTKLKEHLQMVAHLSIRNLASLAGNLMIKYQHREFPSDLYLLLECVGAQLTLCFLTMFCFTIKVCVIIHYECLRKVRDVCLGYEPAAAEILDRAPKAITMYLHYNYLACNYGVSEDSGTGSKSRGSSLKFKTVTMQEFLETEMRGKLILNVLLPPLSSQFKIVTYKVMHRGQSAHAIVNAAFMYELNNNNIVKTCRIVYGGLSPQFNRATKTENFLTGRNIFINSTLKAALNVLESELIVTGGPPKTSPKYRKHLALGLFYKSLLFLCPKDKISGPNCSGAITIHSTRPISTASQVYKTDSSLWPLNQPIQKVEALIQCAGEAYYTDDLPTQPNEMAAAFVLTTVPTGEIVHIDASKALKCKGVVAFYTAKDIPGLNSFTPADAAFYANNEEVFCNGTVKYHSQPIGIVVAETPEIANNATKLVDVTYTNVTKPVLTIEQAKYDPARITLYGSNDATKRGNDVVKVIKNSNATIGQYHFIMENMTCLAQPSDEGLEIHATAHWLDGMQLMIARALNIAQNRVDVHMRRLGGSYGIKLTRAIQSAVACSLAAFLLNRPCRFVVPLTVATKASGKRLPCLNEFEVGVNSVGKIQYMNYDIYQDNGYLVNEQFSAIVMDGYNSCYDKATWNFRCFNAITDTAKNSWCRGPGNLETVAMIEHVMEQIAYELSLDPLEVRLANIGSEYASIKEMYETVKINSEYDKRRIVVDKFNAENRWKKRGLRFCFMRWSPVPVGVLEVNLAVFHGDGSVVITHGGVEMGQGLNTKAVQICAYLLNIPIDKIIVKENNTTIAPNVYATAGSVGSQNVAYGVRQCCEELLRRLEPIRLKLGDPTWEELIKTAFDNNVDLQTHGFISPDKIEKYDYIVYGVALAEVEVDILTGETEIIRVDLEEDVGLSISPLVDVGQVEGAFIMGLGYWTSEQLIYHEDTGELLTTRTWDYLVPLATDIPQDFRVYFRENSYSFKDIFGAKALGEPPICLSVVVALAIREAVVSARRDSGIPTTQWFPIKGPYTVEKIALAAETNIEDFKF